MPSAESWSSTLVCRFVADVLDRSLDLAVAPASGDRRRQPAGAARQLGIGRSTLYRVIAERKAA